MTIDNPGGQALQSNILVGCDWTFIVDGLAERIHDAANQGLAHRHAHDTAGTLDLVAFLDFGVFAEQNHADLVFFQVQGDAGYAVRKGEQLSGHDFVEAVHAGDTVTQGDNGADLVYRDLGFVVLDLLADKLGDFVCFDLCHKDSVSSFRFLVSRTALSAWQLAFGP